MELSAYNRAKPLVETIEKFKALKKQLEDHKSPMNVTIGTTVLSSLDFSFKEIVATTIKTVTDAISYYEKELKNIN